MFKKKRRKREKSILDNPEEFFNSMSREEFKAFLEEFGFEYRFRRYKYNKRLL